MRSGSGIIACIALVGVGVLTGIAVAENISDIEILSLERDRYDAMERADISALDAVLAEELIFTHASGKIDSKETFLKALASGGLDYRAIRTEDLEVRSYGALAVITGKSILDINVRGDARYLVLRFTSVWVQKPTGWQIVAYQSTRPPDSK